MRRLTFGTSWYHEEACVQTSLANRLWIGGGVSVEVVSVVVLGSVEARFTRPLAELTDDRK